MRPSRALLLGLIGLTPFALADVEFTIPAAGQSYAGGTAMTVTWTDSGDAPSIDDLASYQLFLYTGSNDSPTQLVSLKTGGTFTADTVSVTIPVGAGATGTNAYFLGMISTATAGGTVTNWSSRFTLTGMTGTFSAAVQTANDAVTGTTGPDTINDVTGVTTTATSTTATSSTVGSSAALYAVPYAHQTGLTRYAPMQKLPGTTITQTATTRQFATSSASIATTFLPIATISTTITQAGTYSFSSHANTQAAASMPTDDMQKFLARWKD